MITRPSLVVCNHKCILSTPTLSSSPYRVVIGFLKMYCLALPCRPSQPDIAAVFPCPDRAYSGVVGDLEAAKGGRRGRGEEGHTSNMTRQAGMARETLGHSLNL